MRAPHPALREWWSEASAALKVGEREVAARDALERLTADRERTALSAETTFAPLLDAVSLDSALERVTGSGDEPAPPDETPEALPTRAIGAPVERPVSPAKKREPYTARDFEPLDHPRLSPLREPRAATRDLTPDAALSRAWDPGLGTVHDEPATRRAGARVNEAIAALPGDERPRRADALPHVAIALASVSAAAASQALHERALRAGVPDALHRSVSAIPAAVSIEAVRAKAPDVSADSSNPSEASDERVDPVSARIETLISRLAKPAAGKAQVPTHDADHTVSSATQPSSASPRHVRARGGGSRNERTLAPVPPTTSGRRAERAEPLSAPLSGFRGLAELGRAQQAQAPAAAPSDEHASPALPAPRAPRIADDLDAHGLAELLRREAQRYGIDLAGLEP